MKYCKIVQKRRNIISAILGLICIFIWIPIFSYIGLYFSIMIGIYGFIQIMLLVFSEFKNKT